jgi:hypothetical protein
MEGVFLAPAGIYSKDPFLLSSFVCSAPAVVLYDVTVEYLIDFLFTSAIMAL